MEVDNAPEEGGEPGGRVSARLILAAQDRVRDREQTHKRVLLLPTNAALKVWPKAPTKFVLAAWRVLGAHEEEDNILFGGWRLHRGGIGAKVCQLILG